jgi:hypothetical protein
MGSELYRMIRDGAPASWTVAMRLVAGVIADDARDPSQGMPEDGGHPWSAIPMKGHFIEKKGKSKGKWRDGLTERTGMSLRAISRVLADLAAAGYEMREALGKGKDGRVVFTAPEHSMRFRVPPLTPRPVPERSPDPVTIEAERSPDPATVRAERSPNLATPSPQESPHIKKPSPQSGASAVNGSVEGIRDGQNDDDFETRKRQQQDALTEWMRDHPEPADAGADE